MATKYNHTGWKKGGPQRRPTPMVRMIVGNYDVGLKHWEVFEDLVHNSLKKRSIREMPAPLLFYLWIQVYNQHEANIQEYIWVMRGCR